MTEEHRNRVLDHQKIAQLFSCSIDELHTIYREQGEDQDPDSTWLGMIYAIGRWRFGGRAWSDRQIEYFKARARENASILPTGKYYKRPPTRNLTLADIGL